MEGIAMSKPRHSKTVGFIASIGLVPTMVSTLGKEIKNQSTEFVENVKDEMNARKAKVEAVELYEYK